MAQRDYTPEEIEALEAVAALQSKYPDAKTELDSVADVALDTAKRGGKALVRGAGKTVAFLGGLAGNLPDVSKGLKVGAAGAEWVGDNLFPPPARKDQSPMERLGNATGEGAGGAMVMPFGGLVKAGTAGAAAGASGELAGNYAESVGLPRAAGALPASILAGGLTGWGLGPKQSVARQDIRAELPRPGDPAWAAANRTRYESADVGSTTLTAAETFPGNPRLLGLAAQTANSRGGEALSQRLAGRVADREAMGDVFQSRIGPPVSPAQVANELSDAANGVLGSQIRINKDALRARLEGQTIPAVESFKLYRELMASAKATSDVNTRKAFLEVADALKAAPRWPGDNRLQTGVQELSLSLKSMKDRANNPLALASGAQQIGKNYMLPALQQAEEGLGRASPTWKSAMDDFGAAQQNVAGQKTGHIGRLADTNPLSEGATPVGRLNAVTGNMLPPEIAATVKTLENPGLTGLPEMFGKQPRPGPTVTGRDIAQAIATQKLAGRPGDPGKVMRGAEGSLEQRKFEALLTGAGVPKEQVMAPLRVSDNLQKLDPATGVGGFPRMSPIQAAIRPFRTLDMMITGKTQTAVNREVAELLSDPANLPELRKIAQFNPRVRTALALSGATLGSIPGALPQKQEQ